jgi:hypothetical protein
MMAMREFKAQQISVLTACSQWNGADNVGREPQVI